MKNELIHILKHYNINDEVIDKVICSGYYLFDEKILDSMYGSKMFSSYFEVSQFVEYLNGGNPFIGKQEYSNFQTYIVKNIQEIEDILNTPRRKHYISEGTLSYRGQIQEYFFKRSIPNPFRKITKAGENYGSELSILPGIYRNEETHAFNWRIKDNFSLLANLHLIDSNLSVFDTLYKYDTMRVEQHYGNQTGGLDISFDIETAIFFATYKFINNNGKATYRKIPQGEHNGVIYCFRFCCPPIKKTEYLIKDFELCKKYIPERILRQDCGLPLIGSHEKNIAVCDIDCIIYLDKDFDYCGYKTPRYMFPDATEDAFYAKLLQVKVKHPQLFNSVIEYDL